MQRMVLARAGFIRRRALAASCLIILAPCPAFAQEAPYHLAPLTRLRLTVVQFTPTTGDYRRWDALGGEMVVSPEGTVIVPTIGSIPASSLSPDELAAEIADRLQAKLGLIDRPDATVQIVDYPPIYLVGSVATPGQYPFRPGMTVLQAVALGGGEYRGEGQANPSETIKLQGELQGLADDILRSTARVARLQAELAGATEITFPSVLDGHDPAVAEIIGQEQTIFAARQNELTRQTTALGELSELYHAELDVLDQKSQSIDDQVKQAQQQLDGVKQLVEKGVATASRQADLDRMVSGLRSDRLDNLIATMTARQGLNAAMRDQAKLEDDQRSEVSAQLQTEQVGLQRFELNQTTTMRLLRQATDLASDVKDRSNAPQGIVFTIIRQQHGKASEIAATESTALVPGDLLKVSVGAGMLAGPKASPVASR
jgi:protein involved in polysaccharide export with SLBB domain